jgi:hypothetical protein
MDLKDFRMNLRRIDKKTLSSGSKRRVDMRSQLKRTICILVIATLAAFSLISPGNVEAAAAVSDTFTEASDTALTSHTPDTGTVWTEIFDSTTPGTDAQVIASTDIVQAGDNDENNTGQAYAAQPDPTGVDQNISITLKVCHPCGRYHYQTRNQGRNKKSLR